MDLGTTANAVKLCGVIDSEVVYSHSLFGEAFHQFFLLAPGFPASNEPAACDRCLSGCWIGLCTVGRLWRSPDSSAPTTNRWTGANRLILTVFAQSLEEGRVMRTASPCADMSASPRSTGSRPFTGRLPTSWLPSTAPITSPTIFPASPGAGTPFCPDHGRGQPHHASWAHTKQGISEKTGGRKHPDEDGL